MNRTPYEFLTRVLQHVFAFKVYESATVDIVMKLKHVAMYEDGIKMYREMITERQEKIRQNMADVEKTIDDQLFKVDRWIAESDSVYN